jgi:hypothetical protein
MRNFLAIVGAATIAFLAVGWYLGWYEVSSLPSPHGKQSLHVEINQDKITDDVKKGVEKGNEIVDHLRDKQQQPESNGPASSFFAPRIRTRRPAPRRASKP